MHYFLGLGKYPLCILDTFEPHFCIMRKLDFRICNYNGADQLRRKHAADQCLYLGPIARNIDRLYRALLETSLLKTYMNFLASEFGITIHFYEPRHEKTCFAAKTMAQFRCIDANSTIILLTTAPHLLWL